MSVNKSKPQTSSSSSQTSKPISLQEVEGVSIVGNEGGLTYTDAGAIEGSLNLAGLTVEKAAELTLGLVTQQAAAGVAAMNFAQGAQDRGYQFAMDAGRSDIKLLQDGGRGLLIVVGIVSAAWVVHGWGK